MLQDHGINSLRFSFTADRRLVTFFTTNVYSQVISYLLPAIEEVLCLPYFNEYEITIDKLDINVGRVVLSDNTMKNAGAALRKMLEEELRKKIVNRSSGTQILPRKKAVEQGLLQYLLSGVYTKYGNFEPSAILEELLRDDILVFVKFLHDNANNMAMIKRLVWEFRIELTERIVFALNPAEREFLQSFIDRLNENRIIHYKNIKNTVIDFDSQKYHRQILEFTIRYCLQERSVQFNRAGFVYSILNDIANHYSIDFDQFLSSLIDTLNQSAFVSAYKSDLVNMLVYVQKRIIRHETLVESHEESFLDYGSSFLQSISSGISSVNVNRYWKIMCKSLHNIPEFLYVNCDDRRIVKNMAKLLDEVNFEECLKVLAKNNAEFVSQFRTAATRFVVSQINQEMGVITGNVHDCRIYVKEFILEYLIQQKNGIFSEKAFTNSILIDIANHSNISYISLLNAVLSFLTVFSEQNRFHEYKNLLIVLKELHKERCNGESKTVVKPQKNFINQLEMTALYECVLKFVLTGIYGSQNNDYVDNNTIGHALKRLYRRRPDLLQLLFDNLKCEGSNINSILNSHTVYTCETLINYFFKTVSKLYSSGTIVNIDNIMARNLPETDKRSILKTLLSFDFHSQECVESVNLFFKKIIDGKEFKKSALHKNPIQINNSMKPDRVYKLTVNELSMYLHFFIRNPSIPAIHGIDRESLVSHFKARYENLFIREITKVLFEKVNMNTYIRYSRFVFNIDTCCLLSNSTYFKECCLYYFDRYENCNCFSEYITNLFKKISGETEPVILNSFCMNMCDSIDPDLFYLQQSSSKQNSKFCSGKKQFYNNANGSESLQNSEKLVLSVNDTKTSENSQGFIEHSYAGKQKKSVPDKITDFSFLTEKEIQALFYFLQSAAVPSDEECFLYESIFHLLLINSSYRLRTWFWDSCKNVSVLKKISCILSERTFLHFLFTLNNQIASEIFSHYNHIISLVNSKHGTADIKKQGIKLKCAILSYLIQSHNSNYDIATLKTGINVLYIDSLISQDEISLKTVLEKALDINVGEKMDTDDKELAKGEEKLNAITPSLEETPVEELAKEGVLVTNAGVVIGAGYFTRLFAMLKFTSDRAFVDENSVQKAIKLLHYFCTGHTECSEFELVLNKLLCGVDLDHPIEYTTENSKEEIKMAESLLGAIITNWSVMKNTSPMGFRQSFLVRSGMLYKNEDGWLLCVEKRAFDMLMGTLPWGFSIVKFPWMKKVLRVEWKWE